MKKTFIAIAMLFVTLCATAIPAKRGQWKTITLADGSQVKVELRGDEFAKFWQAEDGRTFVKNYSTNKYELIEMSELKEKALAQRAAEVKVSEQLEGPAKAATRFGQNPNYMGEKKGLVILVEFPDMQFTEGNKDLYERIINEKDYSDAELGFVGSVRDYFNDQSNGVFDLTFDIAGPIMMPNNYAYYGANTGSSNHTNIQEFVRYALEAADDEVNYADYDWDGDGQVEQVFFIYAGLGEANGGDENTIWPHKSAVVTPQNTYVRHDGVRIFDYACTCELRPTAYDSNWNISETAIDGIGALCHEYSHCLGLADLYDIDYSGGYGMGSWSLMCNGGYNNNGFTPPCYIAFERMQIGWEEPTELTESAQVRGLQPLSEGGGFYLVRNDGRSDEYYLLENRQRVGRWDAGLDGEGLLIVHVDYNKAVWDRNAPNDDPNHERCCVIPADNNFYTSPSHMGNDAWPYGTNTSLTNSTYPAATVYNRNTDGTYFMNKPITNITQNADGTIDFDLVVSDGPIFYESFDRCAGIGGNDGTFHNLGNTTGKGQLLTDNEGWVSDGGSGASQCAMFTSAATTPEFQIEGSAELTFNVAPLIPASNPTININVSGDAKLSGNRGTMATGRFSSYRVSITGNGPVSITFSSDVTFFLDEVKVVSTSYSGIHDVLINSTANPSDNRIYSIDGRYLGTDINAIGKGLYIKGGKKYLKK